MIEVLRKKFKANPEKLTITINGKCSICGHNVTVKVKQTSGGYGLIGGVLVKYSPEKYSITCQECHKLNSKVEATYRSDVAHT